jgi:hypothetical protein
MRLAQLLAPTMQHSLSAARRGATANDALMMQQALALARQAEAMDEVPVGAVVYRGLRTENKMNHRDTEAPRRWIAAGTPCPFSVPLCLCGWPFC